jgi:hypothetical protein
MSNPLALSSPTNQLIAGMGCDYPDASQLNQPWENILGCHCQVREFFGRRLPRHVTRASLVKLTIPCPLRSFSEQSQWQVRNKSMILRFELC